MCVPANDNGEAAVRANKSCACQNDPDMTFVKRDGQTVVVTQVPFLLIFVTLFFTAPILGFSIYHFVRGTDADGKYFCLVFGTALLWAMAEFVATRERFEIDLNRKTLRRTVNGVFRHPKTSVDLARIRNIVLEIRRNWAGRKRQYLCLHGQDQNYLINSPEKVYINHAKTGELLSELTGIPYRGRLEVD
jgi:hypothetical protein